VETLQTHVLILRFEREYKMCKQDVQSVYISVKLEKRPVIKTMSLRVGYFSVFCANTSAKQFNVV